MITCVICTGRAWLVSPEAIVSPVAIVLNYHLVPLACFVLTWQFGSGRQAYCIKCTLHKTYPEGEKIHSSASSPLSS